MPHDAISPMLTQAANEAFDRETSARWGDAPRVQLATPEEVEAYAPRPDTWVDGPKLPITESEEQPPPNVSAVDIDLPPPEPKSDVLILQDWVTLSGRAGNLIAQDETGYVDFARGVVGARCTVARTGKRSLSRTSWLPGPR